MTQQQYDTWWMLHKRVEQAHDIYQIAFDAALAKNPEMNSIKGFSSDQKVNDLRREYNVARSQLIFSMQMLVTK